MTLKVLAHYSPWNRGIEVAIVVVNSAGDICGTVDPFVIKQGEPDPNIEIRPLTVGPMGKDFLQSALEAAWELGLRPKNWRLETTEQVAAMGAHLEDMRRLVFDPVHLRIGPLPPPTSPLPSMDEIMTVRKGMNNDD